MLDLTEAMKPVTHRVISAINDEFHKAGVKSQFTHDQIGVTAQTVFESPVGPFRKISETLIDHSFPSLTKAAVSHYTSLNALEGILSSQELRLYAVRKRLSEDELTTFLLSFGFDNGLIHDELSDDLFYTSFTESPNSADQLWSDFGDSGRGARLDFQVEAHIKDLRRVYYFSGNQCLLQSLLTRIRSEHNREFLLRGVSRICAFYLPPYYQGESETRLLIYRHAHDYEFGMPTRKDSDGHSYISLPVDAPNSKHYRIAITHIEPGPNCERREFDRLINGWQGKDRA